ncbi:MAG: glycoside hydrolase family 43 protein [Roseburia sp.]
MTTAVNPILNGFYPDPSICAVGNDFYLVCSTFVYFPGVPIFHSTDLAHWEQIGNILDRPSQLPLAAGSGHSQGIFAPTIRYHEGTFYMITTNVSFGGNFIVTAENPAGPWSEPHYLENAPGIDPSLFFDTDGTCYYVGTRPNPEGVRYNGDWEVWTQELDLATMKLVGDSHKIWKGALKNVIWPEGPHLYKKDGYYYLMIAEGGTGPDHCISVARSKDIFAEFEGNPKNPILTHRHLGKKYPIIYVGHGDLVEDCEGNWYVVMLASRPCEGYTNMGRETFLAKVEWEDGWPVVNPGIGKLEDKVEIPLPESRVIPHGPVYSFHQSKLDAAFLSLRNAKEDMYRLDAKRGVLKLSLQPETLKDLASPSYLALRQRHQDYQAGVLMRFTPQTNDECAGIAVMQSNEYHIRFEKAMDGEQKCVRVIRCEAGKDTMLADCGVPEGDIILKITSRGQKADFSYEADGNTVLVAEEVDIRCLSTEVSGGFVGCTIGMYASANGAQSDNSAEFEWMFYDAVQ